MKDYKNTSLLNLEDVAFIGDENCPLCGSDDIQSVQGSQKMCWCCLSDWKVSNSSLKQFRLGPIENRPMKTEKVFI